MRSTGACSASPTRCSCSRRETSRSPRRSVRGCSSAAASSTRRRESVGPVERPADGRHGQDHAACGRHRLGAELRLRLLVGVHPDHPALRAVELGAHAVLAVAEPDPALPLRRLRAVPAAVPPHPSVDGAARSVSAHCAARPLDSLEGGHHGSRAVPLDGRTHMALTPVEIRHLTPGKGFFGYKRGQTDRLLSEIADSFEDVWRERADLADKIEQLEADLVRYKELESLLRTTLVSAEKAAVTLKEQAGKEADLIVEEARSEARSITRHARADHDRLLGEIRRRRSLLRAALAAVEDDVPAAGVEAA